jgi:hypothetical protein
MAEGAYQPEHITQQALQAQEEVEELVHSQMVEVESTPLLVLVVEEECHHPMGEEQNHPTMAK